MLPLLCHLIIAILSLISLSESFLLCPLLGPTIPSATSLPQSPTFRQTLQNITATLNQGIGTNILGVNFNTTSFSISIFSTSANSTPATEPYLWQYHHTAPSLADAVNGVKTVDADSIYRIGSVTKVFTILNFLVNAGDTYWDRSVVEYVPELADAGRNLNATALPLEYVKWEDIRLGDLASHMAGIGRDCEF